MAALKLDLVVFTINRNIAIDLKDHQMGTTKSDFFDASQLRLAQLAKALGHPARIAILQFLISKQACVCGDIVDEIPLSQSTVSQHLKELKEAGLIKGDISGVNTCYCINDVVWTELNTSISAFMQSFVPIQCCC